MICLNHFFFSRKSSFSTSAIQPRKRAPDHAWVPSVNTQLERTSPGHLTQSQSVSDFGGDLSPRGGGGEETVEDLKEKLEQQKTRYEKWKKEHLDDTRTKLAMMAEENKKLQDQVADLTSQLSSVQTHFEQYKAHTQKVTSAWEEERTRYVKRFQEDQRKIDKLQREGKKGKSNLLPKDVQKSSIFGVKNNSFVWGFHVSFLAWKGNTSFTS